MSCNPNPLDACSRAQFQCNNPCFTSKPGCALLPTQIDTFTTQFFGNGLGKSLAGDSIAWNLPCGLDIGVASNPRLPGESLACYFLRLFESGIHGTIGEQGAPGLPGKCGLNAYTITTQAFTQPTLQNPYVSIFTQPNRAMVEGLPIEIQGSGHYIVDNAEDDGNLVVQVIEPYANAPAIIPSGAIVVASGLPGAIIQGPRGAQGLPGVQGATGATGAVGGPGPTGSQGNTVKLISGSAATNSNPAVALTGAYAKIGTNVNNFPQFVTPDNSNSTYFVAFTGFLLYFNPNPGPPTTSGSIFVKVTGPAGDIAGAERIAKFVSDPDGANGYWFYIPLVVTNTSGAVATYYLQGKQTLSNGALGYVNCRAQSVRWFKF